MSYKLQATSYKLQNVNRKLQYGFTLIELIMAMVIGAIILIPISFIIVESLRNAFLPEHFSVASGLLEDRIEWVSNLRFGQVTNQAQTYFTGNFSDYSWRMNVNYVAASDLNTAVDPQQTNYKRAEIKILRPGFPDVTAVTLVSKQ